MKTLTDLLHEADPLGYEPARTTQDRRSARRVILGASRADDVPRRSMVAAAIVAAMGVMAIGVGAVRWLHPSVDLWAAVRFEVRLAEDSPAAGLREIVVPGSARRIYLHADTVVTNSDIASAEVVSGGPGGAYSVSVAFTTEGAEKMQRATRSHTGKPLAILVDGEVVIAPTVRAAVSSSAMITGSYTRAEAERIVAGIVGR